MSGALTRKARRTLIPACEPVPPAAASAPALERRVLGSSHTIVLVQLLPEMASRAYHDFEKLDSALDGERGGTEGTALRPSPRAAVSRPQPRLVVRPQGW